MSDYLMIDSPVISAGWGSPRFLSIWVQYRQFCRHYEARTGSRNGVGSVRGKGVAVFAYHTVGIAVVDSNLHHENILPSEKAFAYRMKLEAMSRASGKCRNNAPSTIAPRPIRRHGGCTRLFGRGDSPQRLFKPL